MPSTRLPYPDSRPSWTINRKDCAPVRRLYIPSERIANQSVQGQREAAVALSLQVGRQRRLASRELTLFVSGTSPWRAVAVIFSVLDSGLSCGS